VSVLYGRSCSVVVDGVKVDGLRVSFRVVKTLTKEPNTLDLKIYNLNARTRAGMHNSRAPVLVTAGYEANAALIFAGDARTVDHTRDGSDWVTHVQCGDGERAYMFGRVSESFAPGTSTDDVIMHCAEQLGLNLGNLPETLRSLSHRGGLTEFKHGYTAHGRASAELDRLFASVGLSWSVQNGAIQVLKGGAPIPGDAVLLSPNTGLIGSPDHGTPDDKGGPSKLKVRSFLNPRLRCGGTVEIRSFGVNGQFRIEKLEQVGDTHGPDWFSNLETKATT
jgi:hypothetical protein